MPIHALYRRIYTNVHICRLGMQINAANKLNKLQTAKYPIRVWIHQKVKRRLLRHQVLQMSSNSST